VRLNKTSAEVIRAAYCIMAVLIIALARMQQIAKHREWTEAQALVEIWPCWAGAVAVILIGEAIIFFGTRKGKS